MWKSEIEKKHYVVLTSLELVWVFSFKNIKKTNQILTVQIAWGLCENCTFRWHERHIQMRRGRGNVWICARCTDNVSEHWRHCFSQHFAWFMHDSWGGCCDYTFLRHSCLTLTDGPQAGRSNLTTSWSLIQPTRGTAPPLQPSCLSVCVCVALHYIIPLSACRIMLAGVWWAWVHTPTHAMQQEYFRCAVHWKEECKAVSSSVCRAFVKNTITRSLIFV